MSIVKLDPKIRKKIEAQLKVKIPTPDEEAFEAFLESLQQSHPELHRELLSSLDVTRMPAEKEAAKAAKRVRIKKVFDALFFLDKWPESRVLDKKRVVYAGLGTLAVLLPLAYLASSGYLQLGQSQSEQPEVVDTAESGDALGGVSYAGSNLEPEDPTEGIATLLFADDQATPQPEGISASTNDTPERTFSQFPSGLQSVTTPAMPRSPGELPSSLSTDHVPSATQPPAQLTVTTLSQEPEQLTVWQQTSASGFGGVSAPTNLEVTDLPSQPSQALTVFERDDQLLSLSIDVSSPEEARASDSATNQTSDLTVFSQAALEGQGLSVSVANGSQTSDTSPRSLRARVETSAPSPDEASLTDAGDAVQSEPQTVQASALAALQPGTRIPATLVTGIRVTEQTSIPVVAETKGNWCRNGQCPNITWLGTARLSAGDRVEVTLKEAVVDTEPRSVSAVSLGDDETIGLQATTQNATVEVARDLLQSAVGGASDYLEALVSQKQITFQDGAVIQEGQVPGIETFILGRFAELISPPATLSEQVKVASVPAGTTFTILYGVDPSQ